MARYQHALQRRRHQVCRMRGPQSRELEISRKRGSQEKRLYPVTILPAATKNAVQALTSRDIILADEIAAIDETLFLGISGLDRQTAVIIKREADELTNRNAIVSPNP
jgi:hypothetical protein